jgi:type VI secretion system protein ImpA
VTSFDLEKLTAEITPENPCGEDISYDADFMELERIALGTAETQIGDFIQEGEGADWKSVYRLSMTLMERSRDLRVILYLTAAMLRLKGLKGFRDGLSLLLNTIENFWEYVHPQLDPDDDNDPLERMNIIGSLSPAESLMSSEDPMKFIPGLMEAPLCTPEDSRLPKPCMRHILVASGELSVSEEETARLPAMNLIDAAFDQTDIEALQASNQLLKDSIDTIRSLDNQLTDLVGANSAPNFDRIEQLLLQMQSKTGSHMERRGYSAGDGPSTEEDAESDGQNADDGTAAPTAAGPLGQALSGQIGTDQEALKAMDMILTYYEQNEPSSPVPLLVKRAKRLVGKSFVDIIRDISPDAMSQVQAVSGEEDTEE